MIFETVAPLGRHSYGFVVVDPNGRVIRADSNDPGAEPAVFYRAPWLTRNADLLQVGGFGLLAISVVATMAGHAMSCPPALGLSLAVALPGLVAAVLGWLAY